MIGGERMERGKFGWLINVTLRLERSSGSRTGLILTTFRA